MASKRPQTMAKRARELAVKEKRERKAAKKADRAENGTSGISDEVVYGGVPTPGATVDTSADPAD